MSDLRVVPAQEARHEIIVARSRFIATAGLAMTLDQARSLLVRIRKEYPDATHHVAAFLIGHGNSVITHCHDDGEPSGTAGRPALAVLQGSGMGDVAVVVTRYFGGTKLGTGGLVRAYGDAVREVLAVLPRARKVASHKLRFALPYSEYERVRRLILAHRGQILAQEFGAEVILTARLAIDDFDEFQHAVREACNGLCRAEVLETDSATVLPLP